MENHFGSKDWEVRYETNAVDCEPDGGDGTLNATVNMMLKEKRSIPIGYIPAGSTNDFASTLGLPGDVVEAAKQIVNGTP